MSRPPGPARNVVLDALQSGFRGDYRALADMVGVRPRVAQATLKELGRVKRVCKLERQRGSGRPGAQLAIYGAYQPPVDALGFALQVWR